MSQTTYRGHGNLIQTEPAGKGGIIMPLIHILDDQTANQIAAGEVVERPVNAVKDWWKIPLMPEAEALRWKLRKADLLHPHQ